MKRTLVILSAALLFVTSPAYSSNMVDYTITSDHEAVPCIRDLPAPRDTFNAQDHKEFYALVVVDSVAVGDSIQFEWFYGEDLYSESEPYIFAEPSRGSVCHGEGFEYFLNSESPLCPRSFGLHLASG